MKKMKKIRGLLTAAFLAAFIISCTNTSAPEKSEKDKTPATDTPEGSTPAKTDSQEVPYKKVATKTINGKTYDIVTFGSFPQTMKDDSVTIDESETKQYGIYTCCKGSDGEWYSENEDSGIYCKVEAIKWRVLTEDYDHDNNPATPGAKLLLAEKILDNYYFYTISGPFTDRTIENNTVYPNDYKHSTIRAYLNGLTYISKSNTSSATQTERTDFSGKGFLQMAFTADEEKFIQRTGATEDKLFLLNEAELSTADYGFSDDASRIKETSDFANSAEAGQRNPDYWWLRSHPEDNIQADIVDYDGSLGSVSVEGERNKIFGDDYWGGVVPALCIF